MSDYGIKVSKKGIDVKTATPKQLIFSSQFDGMKIRRTGTLSIDLPMEAFGGPPDYEMERTYEVAYVHNIGDIPMFLPRITGMIAYIGEGVGITGTHYTVNDLEEQDIPVYGYGDMILEWADVIMKSDRLVLRITRMNMTGENVFFNGRTVTLHYTIFHNRVDNAFNLLV